MKNTELTDAIFEVLDMVKTEATTPEITDAEPLNGRCICDAISDNYNHEQVNYNLR